MQESAAKSASRIAAFCERIGLPALDLLVAKFHGRCLHGVRDDIISLTSLKGVQGLRARLLYSAGLRSIEDVAQAEVEDIHAALIKGKRPDQHGGEWAAARQICASARKLHKARCACRCARRIETDVLQACAVWASSAC